MAEFFSTNLKFLREQRGLSQNKLAKMLGINQTTIARWEDDNRVPTIDNAVDVATILNIPLPILLGQDLRCNNINTIKSNEYDDKIKQYEIDKDIKLAIGKNAELTASDVLKIQSEVNKILMQEMQSEDKK